MMSFMSKIRATEGVQTGEKITNPDSTSVGKIADINTLAKSSNSDDVKALHDKLIDASTQELGVLIASGNLNAEAMAMVEKELGNRAAAHTSTKTTDTSTKTTDTSSSTTSVGTTDEINKLAKSENPDDIDELANRLGEATLDELKLLQKNSKLNSEAKAMIKTEIDSRDSQSTSV